MTRKKRVVILLVAAMMVLLASGFIYGYYIRHGMLPVASHEQGSPTAPHRVLIATQGSRFKDRLVSALSTRLRAHDMYLQVIDVAALPRSQAQEWQAIIIVHTWEFGRPPPVVSRFIAASPSPRLIIDVTTSGSGREKVPGVDVISSASEMDEVPALVDEIERRVLARFESPGR